MTTMSAGLGGMWSQAMRWLRHDRAGALAVVEQSPAPLPAQAEPEAYKTLGWAAERALAPMGPMFHAMAGSWGSDVSPERVLRSVLLMAVLDAKTPSVLVERAAREAALRRFLRVPLEDALTSAGLVQGQQRLLRNPNARQVVRVFITEARKLGLLDREGFYENAELVDAWTREEPVADGTSTAS